MATTTNYGWTTPDDTALVKDGAAAIRTLGSSVDTTTKNLNPSTTLGDIEYRSSTANTNTRLGIGSTGQVLTVAGGVPSWATPAGSGKVLQVISTIKTDTFSQAATASLTDITGLSVTITPSATASKVFVIAHIGVSDVSAGSGLGFALVRASTKIGAGDTAGSRNAVIAGGIYDPERANPVAFSFLDSPSTTSATTYKIQMYNNNATGYVNRTHTDTDVAAYPRGSSTITVWEIGA